MADAKKFSTWVNCVRYSPSGKLLAIMANSKLNSDTKECVGGNDSHGHPPSLDMRIQECDTSASTLTWKQVSNDDANSKEGRQCLNSARCFEQPCQSIPPPPNMKCCTNDPHSEGDTIAIFSLAAGEGQPELVNEVCMGLIRVRGMVFGGDEDKYLVVGGAEGGGVKVFERIDGGKGLQEIAKLGEDVVGRPTGFLWHWEVKIAPTASESQGDMAANVNPQFNRSTICLIDPITNVRFYILNRVKDIASSYDHVSLDFDLSADASWASGLLSMNSYAVYYESDNVLLQVVESDEEYHESGGLLLSAHWDSVSTAPGATDNGMGVVTLLSMFHRASVGQYTDTFLNLEGAAARGRPLLFRTTSRAPLASWSTSRPHANVITGDAFSRGVIRSGTDYSVYEQAGLTESVGQGNEPVLWCRHDRVHIPNIILLTVGPVIILMLVYFEHIIRVTSRIRSGYYHAANVLALTFPLTKHGVVPAPEQQKLSILLHQYVLTWVLLVYTTSAVALGGTYFITTWNAVILLGAILGCVEGMAGARGYEDEEEIGRQRR
ncbi:hypothetical protein BDR06DRAFT_1010872 [Suillus hirtellus]|nr:hypothetical protein BDR06DRAFT_1010872 [Suillus hirtellus]